jgi:hypothetical protein
MSTLAPLLLALALGGAEPATVRCVIATNEVLSLVYTLQSALGAPNITPLLREAIEKDPTSTAAIAAAKSSLAAGPQQIYFYENKRSLLRSTGVHLLGKIELAASASKDLADLGSRLRGLLPVAEHARFMRALATLEPIHRERIWNPNLERLLATQRELEALWKKANGDRVVSQMARFYRSEWPSETPFTIILVPVAFPYRGGRSSFAHSIDAVEVVEIFESTDLPNIFGVMIHEIAHSMSSAAPIDSRHELEAVFSASNSPAALAALHVFEEALATAIGNGYATSLAAKKLPGKWYNDPVIDGFAHDLHPVVKDALEKGRTIDAAFVTAAIASFEKKFPNVKNTPAQVFRSLSLVAANGLDHAKLADALRAEIRVETMQRSAPIEHPTTIEKYEKSGNRTALFVLRRADVDKLARYSFVAAVRPLLERAASAKEPAYVATRSGDSRLKVFLFAESTEEGAVAIARFAKLGGIELDVLKAL